MSSHPAHIALAIGDPAGIGPEVVARMLANPQWQARAKITLISNQAALTQGAQAAGVTLPASSEWLQILDWPGLHEVFEPGIASPANGRFILESLQLGIRLVTEGRADALCFGPLNKGAMRQGGMREHDEMRWFAKLLGYTGPCGELNVLDPLWTARVTSHIPLSEVSSRLNKEVVADAIRMLTEALRAAGNATPRIGVCGLNPHNGDNGNYGCEEKEIIEPGVALAGVRGFPAQGPFPADTIFLRARDGLLDGIVTMYHDQGQIATKLLGFDVGVTVEGGLPFPITTPAHGTAYDIVGKGVAKSTAMAKAFDLACRMVQTRREAVAIS